MATRNSIKAEEILRKLEAEAKTCQRCRLHKTRANVVFGIGPATAEIVLIGEGPGFTEDRTKIPFSGAAGKQLNDLLREAGLEREKVRITNIVLCRPPNNRAPLPDEIEACRQFLERQIFVIKPKLVVTLGRTAARELLGRNVIMGREHGTLLDRTYAGVKFKLFVTYHPAAALYGAEAKEGLQADFKKLGQIIKRHETVC